jgi:hypothetical protein
MMKVIVVFKAFISEWETPTWPPSIQMGVTAGIFLASILLKEMRYQPRTQDLSLGKTPISYPEYARSQVRCWA